MAMKPSMPDQETSQSKSQQISRGMSYPGALSANVLNMVGVGPFITIPVLLGTMGGPQALFGWIAGALLSTCDGLVWAELGSRFPRSGGPYHYLSEAYGPSTFGRLFRFLYLWQTLLIGPLSIASGAVGFSYYASFLLPSAKPWELTAIAMGVCLLCTVLLYRDIRSIQRLSVGVSVVVIASIVWIVLSGLPHFSAARAFDFPANAFQLDSRFWIGLGAASLISVYDYGGYNNVCMIGGEIKNPRRTIPLAVLTSILIVAVLYIGLSLAILGTVPWRQALESKAIVADFMRMVYGNRGADIAVALVLLASLGSVLVLLLGYSRVPYTAAASGNFFKPFSALHPKGGFPTISLLFMGALSAVASFMSLEYLIASLIVIQAMFQFLAQCFAVILLRRHQNDDQVFRMPMYPFPVIVAIFGWLYIVVTSHVVNIVAAVAMLLLGTSIFLALARSRHTWPWNAS